MSFLPISSSNARRPSRLLPGLLLLLAFLPSLAPGAGAEDSENDGDRGDSPTDAALVYPLEPRLARTSLPQATRHDVYLPGPLVDSAFPRRPDGSRRLLLLVAEGPRDDDGTPQPRRLMEWIPGDPPRLQTIAQNLPPLLDTLAVLPARQDTGDLLLLGEDELLYRLVESGVTASSDPASSDPTSSDPATPAGSLAPGNAYIVPILTAEHARLDARPALALGAEPSPILSLLDLGRLLRFEPGPGDLTSRPALDLPVSASPERGGLLLTSPRVTELPRPDRASLYLLGPEAEGPRRLRVRLLDPEIEATAQASVQDPGVSQDSDPANASAEMSAASPAPTAQLTDAWCRLPSAETPAFSWFLLHQGIPHLVVTTFEANQLGVFDKHRVRLFPLVPDRTRNGSDPILAFQSASRRWQPIQPALLDLDGDGHQDFLLLHAEGLSGSDTLADVYYGRADGSFERSPRDVELDTPAGPWALPSSSTPNLLSTPAPDLATLADGQLHLYAGTAATDRRRRPFERRPSLKIPLNETPDDLEVEISVSPDGSTSRLTLAATPHLHDLDGDGHAEVIIVERYRQGRGIVQVVELKR